MLQTVSYTIKQLLARATELQEISESWQLDTELILAQVLGQSREYLYTWPERQVASTDREQFETLFARRKREEPLAYILGKKEFWSFQLDVTPDVLIPRPETELLVESVLELVRQHGHKAAQLVDLGTGSGAIAIALALELRESAVTAVDRSSEALHVAAQNAARLGLKNVQFRHGSWCEGLVHDSVDMIVANPPYVDASDEHLQRGDLRFEPSMALVAADDGLADIKTIVAQSTDVLRNNGWLLVEHGYQQGELVREIFSSRQFDNVESRQDLAGHDRITIGRWSGI